MENNEFLDQIEGNYTKEFLNSWRESYSYLEDSVVLKKLDVQDLEILDELFVIKQDELPPYSFLSRIKKRKFFKQLNQDYYQMNQINGRKPRKKIKIKEKNNITFGK